MVDSWYLDAIWISVAFLGGLLAMRVNLPLLIDFLVADFVLYSENKSDKSFLETVNEK